MITCPAFRVNVYCHCLSVEDGAHCVSAQLYQALSDTAWTVPASATAYWVGEAMGSVDFQDLPNIPDKVMETAAMAASNAAHLAGMLKERPYPGLGGD